MSDKETYESKRSSMIRAHLGESPEMHPKDIITLGVENRIRKAAADLLRFDVELRGVEEVGLDALQLVCSQWLLVNPTDIRAAWFQFVRAKKCVKNAVSEEGEA